MNIYTVYGLLTVLLLILFLAIVAWAYSGKRKQGFDEAAQLPLEENRHGGQDRGGQQVKDRRGQDKHRDQRGDQEHE